MRLAKISLERTVNTGEYENFHLTAEVILDPGDKEEVAMDTLERFMDYQEKRLFDKYRRPRV